MGSFSAKIGALLMKKALGNLKSAMDYHAFGGAAFLGVEKILIKSHGSSNAKSVTACVKQVLDLNALKLVDSIKSAIVPSESDKNEASGNVHD